MFRLQHVFEKDDTNLASNVTINLDDLFLHLTPKNVKEKTLSVQLNKKDLHRQQWNIQGQSQRDWDSQEDQIKAAEQDGSQYVSNRYSYLYNGSH